MEDLFLKGYLKRVNPFCSSAPEDSKSGNGNRAKGLIGNATNFVEIPQNSKINRSTLYEKISRFRIYGGCGSFFNKLLL